MAISKKEKVNLDALIKREDLDAQDAGMPQQGGIPVTELQLGKVYYGLLRKPHFQRETNDWDIDNVVTLIKSFRDGHLIPSVILWTGKGYTFVIDGAHRLSALIAWVNDDYGDRAISLAFFKDIPKRQKEIAQACRLLVAREVGTFSEIAALLSLPVRTPEQVRWTAQLGNTIETQRINGTAANAATSFLTINQRAVAIDSTERYMIENRESPIVIATRAVNGCARGHQYWESFPAVNSRSIIKNAQAIYAAIFEPEDAKPEKDTELQPAGMAHTPSGQRLTLDLITVTNSWRGKESLAAEAIDSTGAFTAKYLATTHQVVKYISGSESSSLGLHPAVYFWGATGNHQPSVFLATVLFFQELVNKDRLIEFTTHRARFEEFLLNRPEISKGILGKHGGWKKSVQPIRRMFETLLTGIGNGMNDDDIEAIIMKEKDGDDGADVDLAVSKQSQWKTTKASLRRSASLAAAQRCPICKARMVLSNASDDHIERRTDGGGSQLENAQLTHKYCNHGFKEFFSVKGLPVPVIASPT